MQSAMRARGRTLAAARLPRDARASLEASTRPQPPTAQRLAQAAAFSSSRWRTVQFPALDVAKRGHRGRAWVALALGAAAMALAVTEAAADTKEGEDPKRVAEQIKERKEEAETASVESKKSTLRKRKTSVREGKCVVSTAAVRGDRTYMEDTSFVSPCKRFAAVYDGHGGAAVSQYLRNQLFALIAPQLSQLDAEVIAELNGRQNVVAKSARRQRVATMLSDAVHKLDQEVQAKMEWKSQGSTAVGVLIFDDVIYSVNVGDSRAVLSRNGDAVELTRDHKPNDPQEQARIESLGGRVQWYGYVDAQGQPIEPYGAYRVNGNLAVARAIGDRDARPFVNGQAEVRQYDLEYDKDEFIVLASDGLWDVFSSSEVVTFVQDVMSGELGGREAWSSGGHSDNRVSIFEWSQQYTSDRSMIKAARRRKVQIANYLVQEALFRGTSDNVSVVVVWLR